MDGKRLREKTGKEGKKREVDPQKSERAAPEVLTLPVAARNLAAGLTAMRTQKQTPEIVNNDCPYLIAACNGDVLRPLPGSRFVRVCKVEQLDSYAEREALVTVAEAARRIGLKPKTLYNCIEAGRIRREHGLLAWGKRWRIEWAVFKACFDTGAFACS